MLSYSLRKRTCGAEIGRADLLAKLFVNRSIDDLLALGGEDVYAHLGSIAADEEFLFMKHLVATQAALRVYTGAMAGRSSDVCTLQQIAIEPSGVHITAFVAINALTEEIRSCGNCGSCGAATKARATLPVLG